VVDVEDGWSQLADGAAPALGGEQRLVLVLVESVLALETAPPRAAKSSRIAARLREDDLTVPLVAGSLLGCSAGLAQGVAAPAAALLDREVLEGLLLTAITAALASSFHQHAPRSTIEGSGKSPDATDRV
jgi:hypothetical protein